MAPPSTTARFLSHFSLLPLAIGGAARVGLVGYPPPLWRHLRTPFHLLFSSSPTPPGVPCLQVLDRYHDRGTVILGKVENGSLSKGDKILIMSDCQAALTTIEEAWRFTGEAVSSARWHPRRGGWGGMWRS